MAARRGRGRRGQAVVFTAFLMLAMVFLVMAAVNSAQLVALKIRLQNAADASALAGATVQARGLNRIAGTNKWIANIWNGMYIRSHFPFATPADANAYYHLNSIFMFILRQTQTVTALTTNSSASAYARSYANANWKQQWGRLGFEYWGNGVRGGYAPLVLMRTNRGYLYYYTIYPPSTLLWTGSVMRSRMARGTYVTYSAVRLTTSGGDFLSGGGVFGKVGKIQAVAQAKPTDGWLFEKYKSPNVNPNYDVKLFPVSSAVGNPVVSFAPWVWYMH